VLEFRCADADWEGALAILDANRQHGFIDKPTYERHGAVLLTARALALEESDPGVAKLLAVEATRFVPDLVPAAALAGRLLGEAGETRWAGKILQTAWRANPHPHLAEAYADLRPGESARERLARVRALVREPPGHVEGNLALARAALDARELVLARQSLEALLLKPTQRVATLMAELEELEHGDVGRAREWMARALRSSRAPAWTADGFVSERWLPVSPVTGRIDAFEWKVPLEEVSGPARVIDEPSAPVMTASGASAAAMPAAPSMPQVPKSPGAAAPAAKTQRPVASTAARTASREPIIPLRHAPDDPGPDPDPAEEPRLDGGSRNGGWRFSSLFR
jgi:HemY protein